MSNPLNLVSSLLLESPNTAQLVTVWALSSLFVVATTSSQNAEDTTTTEGGGEVSVLYSLFWVHLLKFIPAGVAYALHSANNAHTVRRHKWNAPALGLTALLSVLTSISLWMLIAAIKSLKSSPVSGFALVVTVPALLSIVSQMFSAGEMTGQAAAKHAASANSHQDNMISIGLCILGILFVFWDAKDGKFMVIVAILEVAAFSFLSLSSIRVRKLLLHKNPDLTVYVVVCPLY
jgi:hypothetical protein